MNWIKLRYKAARIEAQTLAIEAAIVAANEWYSELTASDTAARWAARLDPNAALSSVLRIAQHHGQLKPPKDPKRLIDALRSVCALVPARDRKRLPESVRAALWAQGHTGTPVTPGPVMRVLLSARLIYRAWRQDV